MSKWGHVLLMLYGSRWPELAPTRTQAVGGEKVQGPAPMELPCVNILHAVKCSVHICLALCTAPQHTHKRQGADFLSSLRKKEPKMIAESANPLSYPSGAKRFIPLMSQAERRRAVSVGAYR